MKMLVVMHSSNVVYGAGRSLLTWLDKSLIDYDLLIRKDIQGTVIDPLKVNQLNNKPGKVIYEWLPFDFCFPGKNEMSYKGKIYLTFNNILAKSLHKKINRIFDDYSIIYLNSMVLWPLITKKHTIYCHIREVFDGNHRKFQKVFAALGQATGNIYIDNATYLPFKDLDNRKLILNNPFNMEKVHSINPIEIAEKLNIPKDKVIFSVFGKVLETKGVEFIIDAFVASDIDAILIIAGDDHSRYAQHCKKKVIYSRKIRWIGEWKKIEELYAITDYIVRGERIGCIGRTVFEGLFSGTGVIIPGEAEMIFNNIEDDLLGVAEKIHCYTPRNEIDLKKIFIALKNTKISQRQFRSNVNLYVERIFEFFQGGEIEKA